MDLLRNALPALVSVAIVGAGLCQADQKGDATPVAGQGVVYSLAEPVAPTLYHDYFPCGADGSFATSPAAGYSTSDLGSFQIAKGGIDSATGSYRIQSHFGFLDFRTEFSDGPDGFRENGTGDHKDGYLPGTQVAVRGSGGSTYGPSPAWYAGKKIVSAYLYLRSTADFCNTGAVPGTYLQEPVQVIGLRCGNVGSFNDRGWTWDAGSSRYILAGNGLAGAGTWNNPSVYPGEMSPVAWRTGQKGTPGYSRLGDIGSVWPVPGSSPAVTVSPTYWKLSSKEPSTSPYHTYAGQDLVGGSAPFDPDQDGFGGWSGPRNGAQGYVDDDMFGASWLIARSQAHLVNSQSLTGANCAGPNGRTNPRNIDDSAPGAFGWYAVKLDRTIIQGLAAVDDAENGASDAAGGVKGIVFSALNVSSASDVAGNAAFYARDQGSAANANCTPYLDLVATRLGDIDNDGYISVGDLQLLVAAWASAGDPATGTSTAGNYNVEADCNLDGYVNIGDLQLLSQCWGQSTN